MVSPSFATGLFSLLSLGVAGALTGGQPALDYLWARSPILEPAESTTEAAIAGTINDMRPLHESHFTCMLR